jgi:hypothetical protein
MRVAALISWLITASGGLYLLVIWLIENEAGGRGAAASRLPLPVICGHALLGLTMVSRWIRVYRAFVPAGGRPGPADLLAAPAERNFPLFVVFAHGLLAVTTTALVVLAALRVGGS